MSISKKNNKKNKSTQKTYKIESLEPRFLMDAASEESYKQWTDELACVAAPTLWTDINALKADSKVNTIIEGLYKKNANTGSLDRAQISDMLEYDLFANVDMGIDKVDQMLGAIRDNLSGKMKEISKKSVITASNLKDKIGTKSTSVTFGQDDSFYYDANIEYKVKTLKNGKLTIDASIDVALDPDITYYKSFFSSESYLKYLADKNMKTYGNDFFCADMTDTSIGIEADFDFFSYSKRMEFTFVLDGKVSNGVDQVSTLNTRMKFNENGDARYGVLDLVGDSDNDADLLIANRWTISEKQKINQSGKWTTSESTNNNETRLAADLTYSVKDAESDFDGDVVTQKFNYTKSRDLLKNAGSLSFDSVDEGSWSNKNIEKYGTFTMGRIIGKLQEVSSRLNAVQNGEFHDNKVDFGGLLSQNAHSLLNLSAMLDDVINDPPQSLQELVERMNASPYKADSAEKVKIEVNDNSIKIHFNLAYCELDEKGNKNKNIASNVALSKEGLESILHAEVLENGTVEVKSSATLEFDLSIPFKDTENVQVSSPLYEMGLDQTDDQLATVIGAKAFVASNPMEHHYWGESKLEDYVAKQVLRLKGMPSGVSFGLNSGKNSYALYYGLEKSYATLNFLSDSGVEKFNPTGLAEFKGAVANKCIVLKWNDAYKKITYEKKDRVFDENKVEFAVSTINAIFAQSKIDCIKDLKAVAFDDCIVILLGTTKETSKEKETEANNKIKEELDKIFFVDGNGSSTSLNGNLSEVWISDELSPAHYDDKAVMTVSVGDVSYDLEFAAGYFNSATSVADIANSLQEMINARFHWNIDDETGKFNYEPIHLFVESFEGRIRFVSLQDYAIDFHDKAFAEWLGFESNVVIVDEARNEHSIIATSSAEVEKMRQNRCVADKKVRVEQLKSQNFKKSLNLKISVDGEEKNVSVKEGGFEKAKLATDVANILQKKINKAFGWDNDSALLIVACHNDCLCFRSFENFSVSTVDQDVLDSLGFAATDVMGNGDGSRSYIVSNVQAYHSTELDSKSIQTIKDYASDVEFTIVFDENHKYTVKCGADDFVKMETLVDVAYELHCLVQNACPDYSLPFVSVDADLLNNTICFSSKANFSLYFDSVASAKLFGFDEIKKEPSNEYAVQGLYVLKDFEDCVKSECMQIWTQFSNGDVESYKIDISSIVEDYQEVGLKNCTICDQYDKKGNLIKVGLLNRIVKALNEKIGEEIFEVDKREIHEGAFVGGIVGIDRNSKIVEIIDLDGYSLATLLGLTGKYGIDVNTNRSDFYVTASLVDDYIKNDSDVPLFQNFNLTIRNHISKGDVSVPVNYGVIGETVELDLTGEKCTTRIMKTSAFRMKNLREPKYTYKTVDGSTLKRSNNININDGIENASVAGTIEYDKLSVDDKGNVTNVGAHLVYKDIFNNPDSAFCSYTKGELYSGLYAACLSWYQTYFGKKAKDGASTILLPMLGKTVADVMGLQPKLSELNSLLSTDISCSTIQELIVYITEKTGVDVFASYQDGVITLDFVWNTSASNKLVELDSLYLGRDDFKLNGLFKAYLNAQLTFKASVKIYEKAGGVVIDPSKPQINGNFSLKAQNICADLEINVEEEGDGKKILKQAPLQVESQTGKESNVFLNGVVAAAKVNDDYASKIEMNLGGDLYLYRYGGSVGVAKISVATQNAYSGNSSWNGKSDEQSLTLGKLVCRNEQPGTVVVWKKENSIVPDKGIKKGNLLVDLTGVEDIDLKQTSLFDKLRQSVDGLSDSVRRLQSSLSATVMNANIRNIPLLGDSIVNIGDSLSFLNDDFIEPFRKYVYKKTDGLNAGVVAQKLYTILGKYISDDLELCSDAKNVEWATKTFNRYYKGIQFYEDENEAYWHVRLCATYTLEKGADFDLGFPGLGLRGEGGVDIGLEFVFDFGFGISLKDGAFLLLSNGHDSTSDSVNQAKMTGVVAEGLDEAHVGDDLNLKILITPNAVLKGSLGFLAMNAELKQKKCVLNLGLDLNDGQGFKENKIEDWTNDAKAKSVIRFKELLSNISTEANLRGEMDLGLSMTLGIGGYGASAPHIDTGLHVGWSADFGDGFGSLDSVKFDPIVFDCGSFVKNTVGGIVEKVERLIKPIRPLIKFLQSEIPVLNQLPAGKVHMTVLDLVKKFGAQKGMNFGFLDDIIEMDNVVKKLNDIANKGLMLSEWTIFENIEKFQNKVNNADAIAETLSEITQAEIDKIKEKAQAEFEKAKDAAFAKYNEACEEAKRICEVNIEKAKKAYDQINEGRQEMIDRDIESAKKQYAFALEEAQKMYDDLFDAAKSIRDNAIANVKARLEYELNNAKARLEDEVSNAEVKLMSMAQESVEKYVKGSEYIMGKVTNVEKFLSENMDRFGIKSTWVDRAQAAVDLVTSGNLTLNDAVDYAKDFADEKINQVNSVINNWKMTSATDMSSVQVPEFGGNWEFPIIDNPKDEIMKMIMGGHADLVVFDMRPLKFNFDWSKSFPIIGPLCADVGFSFGVDIDLCFGYDTCGVERWAQSNFKNIGALIDGFYVADWDLKTGEDIAEVVFHSGVVAGASICGRFGVNVGLNLNVNMDFKDPNNDGKIRLGEMAEMLSLNPLDTFDVSASISARAYAYLDVVFYRKEWTLWSSGAFDLFKTASEQKPALATRSGENLIVNVGEYAKENSVVKFSEDGDDDVNVIISDSNTVEIILKKDGTEKSRTYENISENNLCIYAGEGVDTITVSSNGKAGINVFVYAGSGDDEVDLSGLSLDEGCFAMVVGSTGMDFIKGVASGTDYLFGDEGCLTYTPETKNDKKKTIAQAYSYPTEAGEADIIVGSKNSAESKNFMFGGAGNDFIAGGFGENYIFADYGRLKKNGKDYIADRYDTFDEGGDDLVYGGKGVDHIYGGAGADYIHAKGGNDEIHGGQGNDVIYGGAGDDTIYGDDGTDVIFGDAPVENMTIARSDNDKNSGAQLPYGFVAHDLKGMKDAEDNYISPFFNVKDGVDIVSIFNFVEKYVEKNFPESTEIENSEKTELSETEEDSEICARARVETLLRNELNDLEQKEKSKTLVEAFADWWLNRQTEQADYEEEDLVVEALNSFVASEDDSSNGSDVIDGGNGADVIFGDDGKNAVDAGKEAFTGGNDVIAGGAGNDFIDGDAGDDTIDAGSGMDVVYGGRGNDTLNGGSGNDFVFGDDGWVEYKKDSPTDDQWFNKNGVIESGEAVFGETIASVGRAFGVSNEAKSNNGGGDDTIIAGNDSDFIDGQSGNDTYKVQFMGGDNETVTNVLDSGNDANDKVKVFGTIENDNVFVRASDAGLGVIARAVNANDMSKIERINYWKLYDNDGVEFASVDTGAGSDTIEIDSTLTPTDVNGGDDNDRIQLGVMYSGLPSSLTVTNPLDVYDSSIMHVKDGYLSIGTEHSLSIKGGAGDDIIDVYHTDASLALFGNVGKDTFNINSVVDKKGNGVKNHGQISIVGGTTHTRITTTDRFYNAKNIVNVFGLPYGSTYSFEHCHLLASNLDISFNGIRDFYLYGSQEQDSFYVQKNSNLTNAVHHIEGNGGFDHLIYGEDDLYYGIRFSECVEKMPSGMTFGDVSDIIHEESKKQESENIKVIVVDENGNDISDRPYLNASYGKTKYGIKLSKKPSESVVIRVMIPDVSEDDALRGLEKPTINGSKNYADLMFTQSNYDKVQYVTVEVPPRNVESVNLATCIYHDVLNNAENDVYECPSVLVWQDDNKNEQDLIPNGFMDTIHRTVDDCTYDARNKKYSLTVQLNSPINPNCCDADDGLVCVRVVNASGELCKKIYSKTDIYDVLKNDSSSKMLMLSWNSEKMDSDADVYISYISLDRVLCDESEVFLKYAVGDYGFENERPDFVFSLEENGSVYSVTNSRDSSKDGYFYKVQENCIIICSNETGEEISVSGKISFVDPPRHHYYKDVSFDLVANSVGDAVGDAFWTYSEFDKHNYLTVVDGQRKDVYARFDADMTNTVQIQAPDSCIGKTVHVELSWPDKTMDPPPVTVSWIGADGWHSVTTDDVKFEIDLPVTDEFGRAYIYLTSEQSGSWFRYVNISST